VGLQDVLSKPNRHLSEFLLLSIYRLVTSLAPATPLGVSFVHHRKETAEDTESSFTVPVDFGASEDRIAFAVELAEVRLPSFDPYLHELLVRHFEHMAEASRGEPTFLWAQVKKAMAPRLSQGTATTSEIARDLGMSTRTLSRRLHEEGKTFSGVLDELRAELAIHYIRIKGLPISEIAWLLGYREASAVVVAFRRWTGMSPTELRRRYETLPALSGTASPHGRLNGRPH
jgi:AraC-like DNA-binding protein